MARKPARPTKQPSLTALQRKRRQLQESLAITYLEKTHRLVESYYDGDDFAHTDLWDRTRGRNRYGRKLPPTHPSDRRGGRNFPVWVTLFELDDLRQNSRVAYATNAYALGLVNN